MMVITFSGFLGSSWEMYLNKCAGSTSISILSITVRLCCLTVRSYWLAGWAGCQLTKTRPNRSCRLALVIAYYGPHYTISTADNTNKQQVVQTEYCSMFTTCCCHRVTILTLYKQIQCICRYWNEINLFLINDNRRTLFNLVRPKKELKLDTVTRPLLW